MMVACMSRATTHGTGGTDVCDDVTEDDIEKFTEGDCHIFAWHVQRVTGWPIHVFNYGGPDLHAFNLAPDGRPFDVEGISDWRAFRKKWSTEPTMRVSYRRLRRTFGGPRFCDSHARARELAPLVVQSVWPS